MTLHPLESPLSWALLLSGLSVLGALLCRALWKRAGPRPRRGWSTLLCLGLALLSMGPLSAGAWLAWFTLRPRPEPVALNLAPGVRYRRLVRDRPRPLVIHLVTVEARRRHRVQVTPPRTDGQVAGRTTSAFLQEFGLELAINGQAFFPWRSSFWGAYPAAGEPVSMLGLNASEGVRYGNRARAYPTIYFDRAHRPSFSVPAEGVFNAISGMGWLVKEGAVAKALRRQPGWLQPRSALACDRGCRRILLVVVDGRQPRFSEGMTQRELAELLIEHGAYQALNLDGGGSSALVLATEEGSKVLNSPIDQRIPGRQRVVGNHLGFAW